MYQPYLDLRLRKHHGSVIMENLKARREEESWEVLSSRYYMTGAHIKAQHLWLPTHDMHWCTHQGTTSMMTTRDTHNVKLKLLRIPALWICSQGPNHRWLNIGS